MTQYYYRFEDQTYSVGNEDGDHLYSIHRVHLRKLKVLRETPCGVQLIGLPFGSSRPRFVNNSHRKRFAYPTVEEAAASFRIRKSRQEAIHLNRAKRASNAVVLLDRGDYEVGKDW